MQPHNSPLLWTIHFPDATSVSNQDGASWADIADLTSIGGAQIHLTRQPALTVSVLPTADPHTVYDLVAPCPSPFFAFQRWATSLHHEESRWLYTTFGYIVPTYRVTMTISGTGVILRTVLHSHPFDL